MPRLAEWLTASGTSDEVIGGIDRAAAALAAVHARTPAAVVLGDARQFQERIQGLLTGDRLRHRWIQAAALYGRLAPCCR